MKWELHCHTSNSSRCGKLPARQVIEELKRAGYDGVVITDHFNNENIEYFSDVAAEAVELWLDGFEQAKAAGDELGVRVLFGLEPRLQDCDNDYLVYGAEPAFVQENPQLNHLTLPELHQLCGKYGALLIQAHANRNKCHPVDPKDVDGFEVHNGNPRHESNNAKTKALADAHPELLQTSGSDYHRLEDLDHGGILTEDDIRTSEDLVNCLRARRYTLIER